MADFVRVHDPKTGATYNASAAASTDGLEVLKESARDVYGNLLPTVYDPPGAGQQKKEAGK